MVTNWELTKWELTKWEVDDVGIDKVGIDKVGIDKVGRYLKILPRVVSEKEHKTPTLTLRHAL